VRLLPAAILSLLAVTAFAQTLPDPPARIEVHAIPITSFDARDPDRRRFGALEFRGGLELNSPYREFGGLSSLNMRPDGAHFITLSDKGRWFRGRIVYRDGKPDALVEVETAPALGPDGKPLAGRGWFDTESLAERDGVLYVGIERVNQIVRFDYARDGLLARAQVVPVPPDVKTLPNNKGLECLTAPPKGMPLADGLIAISERGLDADGNLKGYIVGGASAGAFSVKRSDEYDISDCAVTPDADLLLLERRASWRQGISIRMRRVPLNDVRAGALLEGKVLIEADMGFQIDNMEGLGIHRAPDGTLILTLVSDDNFSAIQRTILLQFALVE
jgi:hypothetical protein